MIRILLCSIFSLSIATLSWADGEKEDVYYTGIGWTQLDFENILSNRQATASAATFIFGSYITDYVKTEVRAGFGIDTTETTVSNTPDATGQKPFVEVSLDYYASWYMGAQYPATEYMQFHALFGLTHMIGKVDYPDSEQQRVLPEDLTDSSFSVSYLLGVDIRLYQDFWAGLEFGRLHKDTLTDIRTYQMSATLKYEF